MKFNTQKFALAGVVTMGIAYVVCGVFVLFAPNLAVKFLGWMLHLVNIEKVVGGAEVTLGSFVLGALPILLYTYATAYVFAFLYNKFTQPKA